MSQSSFDPAAKGGSSQGPPFLSRNVVSGQGEMLAGHCPLSLIATGPKNSSAGCAPRPITPEIAAPGAPPHRTLHNFRVIPGDNHAGGPRCPSSKGRPSRCALPIREIFLRLSTPFRMSQRLKPRCDQAGNLSFVGADPCVRPPGARAGAPIREIFLLIGTQLGIMPNWSEKRFCASHTDNLPDQTRQGRSV